MRKVVLATVLLVGGLAVGDSTTKPVTATTAKPAAAPKDAASRKEVGALVDVVLPEDVYKASLAQMGEQLLPMLRMQNPNLPADAAAKLNKAMIEALPYNELKDINIDAYSSRFTPAEVKELIAFYSSPVGKKVARSQPEMQAEMQKKLGALAQPRLPLTLKKYGLLPSSTP
jgi:hypothetical protein